MFLAEAIRIGRALRDESIRHEGRCTWLSDRLAARDGYWSYQAGTLGAGFATGATGVGWFLARVSPAAEDPVIRSVSIEALRQGLMGANDLIASRRFGFHEGALGVAWAAIDAGRLVDCAELVDGGIDLAHRTAAAFNNADAARAPELWNGDAGVLTGFQGLWQLSGEQRFYAAAQHAGVRLMQRVPKYDAREAVTMRKHVGLFHGNAGAGLALAAWSNQVEESADTVNTAINALRTERAWLSPGVHWYGAAAHPWADESMTARSLCSGAAGIGIARLGAYAVIRSPHLLAEASAAIEIIRGAVRPDSVDASLCHGIAGEVELLVNAWTCLGERSHLDAARRMGSWVIETARVAGGYGSGLGEASSNRSLLLGKAGTALVLLRLHDPATVPCPALPSALP